MKCARLHLHERSKSRVGSGKPAPERPRRYCQRRMVDPELDEDPRWTDLLERFRWNSNDETLETLETFRFQAQQHEDLYLSVQNLKFDGTILEQKRPKTCYKYKALSNGKKHRMFVKQVVEEEVGEECSSQLTCYYFDDYVKNIVNNEQSAPASETGTVFHPCKGQENKAVQVESRKQGALRKQKKPEGSTSKQKCSEQLNETVKHEPVDLTPEDTKVTYHKRGKRKCLTISRAQSPETVQVIRVDVVCNNYSTSSTISDLEDNRKNDTDTDTQLKTSLTSTMKTSHFTDKYLLTNTTKTLDENVSGGAKVTLLCKTFRLSRRATTKPGKKKGSD